METNFLPASQYPGPLMEENRSLREMLAFCYCPQLYCDDGELQDNTTWPHIDFKRDSIKEIKAKFEKRSCAQT